MLAAEIEIPEDGAEGVLVCCGGTTGGYTLFVHEGRLHWEHNWFNAHRYRVSSDELPAGRYVVSAEITCDDDGKPGTGGKVTLRRGTDEIGTGTFDQQVPFPFTVQESFDIGCDLITPVSSAYESPARFTGTVFKVMVDISDRSFAELAVSEEARQPASDVKAKIAMALQ